MGRKELGLHGLMANSNLPHTELLAQLSPSQLHGLGFQILFP